MPFLSLLFNTELILHNLWVRDFMLFVVAVIMLWATGRTENRHKNIYNMTTLICKCKFIYIYEQIKEIGLQQVTLLYTAGQGT